MESKANTPRASCNDVGAVVVNSAVTRNSPPRCRFLDLPAELRLMIYDCTFDSENIQVALPCLPGRHAPLSRKYQSLRGLLSTCHQICAEAWDFIYKSRVLEFDLLYRGIHNIGDVYFRFGSTVCKSIEIARFDEDVLFAHCWIRVGEGYFPKVRKVCVSYSTLKEEDEKCEEAQHSRIRARVQALFGQQKVEAVPECRGTLLLGVA